MTINDIKCFMTVAETKSFSKTSELMYISQPSVTSHINSLESELGTKLFDRKNKKNVHLTSTGQLYYEMLLKCQTLYKEAMNKIVEIRNKQHVSLCLLNGMHLPDEIMIKIKDYVLSHRGFPMWIDFINVNEIENNLLSGKIIICPKENIPKNKSLICTCLTKHKVPYMIIATKMHKSLINGVNEESLKNMGKSALFLPDFFSENKCKEIIDETKQILNSNPDEIFTSHSPNTISQFLRGNSCFTVGTGWQIEVNNPEYITVPLSSGTYFYAAYYPDLVINPAYPDYLNTIFSELNI